MLTPSDIAHCRCGHAADQHYAAPIKGLGVPYVVTSEKSKYPCVISGCFCADFQIYKEEAEELPVNWRYYKKQAV